MFDTKDTMFPVTKSRVLSRRNHSTTQSESFSSQSILSTVQEFVTSVNTMNQTVMLPSRLIDMQIEACDNRQPPGMLRNEKDPSMVFGMLNTAKNDILNGISYDDEDDDEGFISSHHKAPRRVRKDTCIDRWAPQSGCSTPVRRESTLSMMSVASSLSDESDTAEDSSLSDCTDSALGVDCGLVRGGGATPMSSVEDASIQARHHLSGLQECLSQMSECAVYITNLYREDMSK